MHSVDEEHFFVSVERNVVQMKYRERINGKTE